MSFNPNSRTNTLILLAFILIMASFLLSRALAHVDFIDPSLGKEFEAEKYSKTEEDRFMSYLNEELAKQKAEEIVEDFYKESKEMYDALEKMFEDKEE